MKFLSPVALWVDSAQPSRAPCPLIRALARVKGGLVTGTMAACLNSITWLISLVSLLVSVRSGNYLNGYLLVTRRVNAGVTPCGERRIGSRRQLRLQLPQLARSMIIDQCHFAYHLNNGLNIA